MAFWPANTPTTIQPSKPDMASLRSRIPGQTAPRIIATIKQADRRSRDPLERNPFTDPPCGYDEILDENRKNQRVLGSCKHYWTTQTDQSVLPTVERGLKDSRHRIACFCQQCRWHVDLTITCFANSCPSLDAPLHHFVDFRKLDEQQEWYSGRCSSCDATLDIEYRAPRLSQEDVGLLTDTAYLQQRFRIARDKDPDRPDLKVTSPLMVLDALACYIKDSLEPQDTHRAIPRLNRRFLLSFGEDCEPLLKKLDFVQTEETWKLPVPPLADPWAYDLRQLLQDVQEELWALMRLHMQSPHPSKLKGYKEKPEAFDNDIQLLLSTIEYDKFRVVRRTPMLNQDEERWFSGLGAIGDFSDELLIYSFDRQTTYDPTSTSYYFDCLTKLANKRQSETLEIKVMTLASEGYFGREDITKAYKYFSLDAWNATNYSDEYIRNTFEARLDSVQAWQETEMRQMLRVIALSRGSRELEGAAANDMKTADQALKWLASPSDSSTEYNDEQITTLAAVKYADAQDSADREKVKTAVKLIAEQRDSYTLRFWQPDGNGSFEDDELTQAYKYYNIDDRSGYLDLDVLQTMLTMRQQDPDASQKDKDDAQKHRDVLAKHSNVSVSSVQRAADYGSPVGLNNLGNTCYLNSLLQYLYAIKPFRDLVTNFDAHKQPLDGVASNTDFGTVGGMKITAEEAADGQELLPDLAALFNQMTTAPGPDITPAWKLACLALKAPETSSPTAKVEPATNGRSTTTTPASPPESTSDASDVTLVGDIVLTPDSDADDGQKENATDEEEKERADSMEVEDGTLSAPTRPPPVPPRPAKTGESWKAAAQWAARQHDVHEVVTSIENKTLSAIRPDGIGADGKRDDAIKRLFYSTTRHVYPNKELVGGEEDENTFIIHLEREPIDISEGLDNTFGRETVDVKVNDKLVSSKRYQTIVKAAPFLQIYHQNQKSTTMINPDGTHGQTTAFVEHNIKLPATINMARWMDNPTPALLELRQESWQLRERRQALRDEQEKLKTTDIPKVDGTDALDASYQWINSLGEELELGDDSPITSNLQAQAASVRSRKDEINTQIAEITKELESLQFDKFNAPDKEYSLFAVFIHRGTTTGGHYWIYIQDFVNKKWRKYEDSTVEVVADINNIMEGKITSVDGRPNFVVYVKDDEKEALTAALHRLEPEHEEGEIVDVEMMDFSQPQHVDPKKLMREPCPHASFADEKQIDTDEEMARRLQAELYGQEFSPQDGVPFDPIKLAALQDWIPNVQNDNAALPSCWNGDRSPPADREERGRSMERKGIDIQKPAKYVKSGRPGRSGIRKEEDFIGEDSYRKVFGMSPPPPHPQPTITVTVTSLDGGYDSEDGVSNPFDGSDVEGKEADAKDDGEKKSEKEADTDTDADEPMESTE